MYELNELKSFYKDVKHHIDQNRGKSITLSVSENITDTIKDAIQNSERQKFLRDLIDDENIFHHNSGAHNIFFKYNTTIAIVSDLYCSDDDNKILEITSNEKNKAFWVVNTEEQSTKCGVYIEKQLLSNIEKCDNACAISIINGENHFKLNKLYFNSDKLGNALLYPFSLNIKNDFLLLVTDKYGKICCQQLSVDGSVEVSFCTEKTQPNLKTLTQQSSDKYEDCTKYNNVMVTIEHVNGNIIFFKIDNDSIRNAQFNQDKNCYEVTMHYINSMPVHQFDMCLKTQREKKNSISTNFAQVELEKVVQLTLINN